MKDHSFAGKLQFGTKAATLSALRGLLKHSLVCECFIFRVSAWNEDRQSILDGIAGKFSPASIIVRSSALNEDDENSTMAGAYLSVKDVDSASPSVIEQAIEEVISSYGDLRTDDHEVLVQPMIENVSMSGVIFSHDLGTGAPYYVINYDDVSGRTDTVTSGSTDTSRTLLIHRSHMEQLQSQRFRALLRSVQEIEELVDSPGVDLEFAVTLSEDIYIFQVRRISLRQNWNRDISRNIDMALGEIHAFLAQSCCPKPGVHGQTTVFGEMPDWNPAEMIGTVPRPLARSLYARLITDSVWAEGRAEMGYRDLTGRPLMVNLCGRAFIDVRESFNSFLPATLPDETAGKLADAWIARLKAHPELHDKVEFDILVTTYTLDFDRCLDQSDHGLTPQEREIFRACSRDMTAAIIRGERGGHDQQQQRLKQLESRRTRLLEQSGQQPLLAVRSLLQDCSRLGTLPFAILARHGFIAEAMLRSMVTVGALTEARVAAFKSSVPTVLSDFLCQMHACQRGDAAWDDFFSMYGHLRPGTYDILASRYDQHVLSRSTSVEMPPLHAHETGFSLVPEEVFAIEGALGKAGLGVSVSQLFDFMRKAIAGREYGKLVFTRNISDALELVAKWGEDNGLSRDELSFLTIEQILQTLIESASLPVESRLRVLAHEARRGYEISQAIRLPFLICSAEDIYVIPLLKSRANFVTAERIQAPLQYISDHALQSGRSSGKVILIERADPGYDWIFLSPIAGLITKYGGSNSHMAIRCAELNIPAAIGCGEQMFDQLQRSASVLMDCAAGILVPIR